MTLEECSMDLVFTKVPPASTSSADYAGRLAPEHDPWLGTLQPHRLLP
eukprot:CAMPEP_0197857776 /NCGR_PEP_ID=MMETSP1438-20131217/31147_1 /TAXON_ID=1461541 /ORGANISM="Pterosperma sp., Strain CCMP1384" /LENGTH=47 /DNA_ID= /DNA_START= /DNA_END= /DNA_ORIENTATION=